MRVGNYIGLALITLFIGLLVGAAIGYSTEPHDGPLRDLAVLYYGLYGGAVGLLTGLVIIPLGKFIFRPAHPIVVSEVIEPPLV